MIKLLVFDLDGTLVDTRLDLHASVNSAFKANGLSRCTLEQVVSSIGNGATELIRRCLAIQDATLGKSALAGRHKDLETDILKSFLKHYLEHCADQAIPYPGVYQALDQLADYRMALLTNKPGAPTVKILSKLGFSGYFTTVIGGDTPFGKKPESGALRHIMEIEACSPAETTVIGDGIQDLQVAASSGCHFIGYLSGLGPADALTVRGVDAAFRHFDQLTEVIRRISSDIGKELRE